ncbi:Ig-like domain-containing protein [Burkholderia sp. BCC1640]|uniref:Ig-like domain-containing protein n=1 Tax=Burkholderia sp. BCC1640 TaxID=2676294 RepID=UPI00158EDFE9|nr:Ig-like domain-containing protein [Burkholderia sp. BCC1640]
MSVIKIIVAGDHAAMRVVDPGRTDPVATTRIKATPNARYILADAETGKPLQGITVQRHGDDLLLSTDGNASPQIVIEHYYGSNGQLLAAGESEQYYAYDNPEGGVATLADGEAATLAVPGPAAAEPGAPHVNWTTFGLGAFGMAAATAGAVTAASGGGGDGGGDGDGAESPRAVSSSDDATRPPAPAIRYLVDDVEPVIGRVGNGGMTNDPCPTVEGTGKVVGDTILVYVDDTLVGSTTVSADGTWSFRLEASRPLPDGTHGLHAVEVGANGQSSAASERFEVTAGPAVPSRPLLDWVLDDAEPHVGIVNRGGVTNDATPTLQGRGEIGTTVYLYDNGGSDPIGSTTIDERGTWSLTLAHPMEDGEHSFTAVSINRFGHESAVSRAYAVTVDTTPPAQPTIDSVYDDIGPVQGPVDNPGYTDDAAPVLSGKAEKHAVVRIYDGDDVLGSTTADDHGNWVFMPGLPLADGRHDLTAVAMDAAGNSSVASEIHTVTVDTTGPGTVTIVAVIDDVEPQTGTVANGGFTNDVRPTLQGVAKPNVAVTIRDGDTVIGTATADELGNWRFTPDSAHALAEGPHTLTAQAVDLTGQQSEPSGQYEIVVDTTPPDQPTVDTVIDDVGPVQGTIQNNGYTDDTKPALSGHAEARAHVTILDGTHVLGTVMADLDGHWTFTPPQALSEGKHAFTVVARDAAGNASVASDAFVVNVDTAAPRPPVITQIMDDVGSLVGNVIEFGITDDSKPMFGGTSEPFTRVTLYAECGGRTEVLGSVQADERGNWVLVPDDDLNDGIYHVSASATDRAGNVSDLSPACTIQIDTTLPRPPWITDVIDGVGAVTGPLNHDGTSVTDDSRPTIKGTADAYALVYIYDKTGREPTLIGSTKADAGGKWLFEPGGELVDGKHEITARVQGATGVLSDPSDGFGFKVEAAVSPTPSAPEITAIYDDAIHIIDPNGTTDAVRPYIVGKATPGFTIYIYEDAQDLMGSTVADQQGHWSFRPNDGLDGGVHSFSAISEGPDGETYGPSNSYTIEIEDAWYRLDSLFVASSADDVAQAAQHSAPHDVTNPAAPRHAAQETDPEHDGSDRATNNAKVQRDTGESAHRHGDGTSAVDASVDKDGGDTNALPAADRPAPAAALSQEGMDARAPSGMARHDAAGEPSAQCAAHETDADMLTIGDAGVLKLSLLDVLQDGAPDLFGDDGHAQLRVNGQVGDVLDLSDLDIGGHDWAANGDAVIGGVAYTVYENGAHHAELLVQHGIDAHFT